MRSAQYTRLDAGEGAQHRGGSLLAAAEIQARILRRDGKLQFVCGAFSIMLAVVCAVVVAVIVDRAPQLFMNMGEVYMGQNDLQLFSMSSYLLNYSLIADILAPHVRGQFVVWSEIARALAFSCTRLGTRSTWCPTRPRGASRCAGYFIIAHTPTPLL